tara:strand:- start:1084 stop:2517 length:1434 start_codon:yes stop_codon:yes gene_type:complete
MTAQTILPANSVVDSGFNVDNSVRFDRGSSPTMIRTIPDDSSSTGNRVRWTFSTWIKRTSLGTLQALFGSYQSSNYHTFIGFNTSDQLDVFDNYNGSKNGQRITNRVFRDTSAWYHLCIIWDKNNGTDGLKIRIFVNGLEESSFATSSVPSNSTTMGADNQDYSIGKQEGVGNHLDAYLCETVFQDGVAQNPVDALGEFDDDSSIFKPIDPSEVTFGNNGFHLDFKASGNLGNDANGGTDYSEANIAATDQATDTCTNNFCTINPLDNFFAGSTLAEGNCKVTYLAGSGKYAYNTGTITLTSGKWYHEVKIAQSVGSNYNMFGIEEVVCPSAGHEFLESSTGFVLNGNNGKIIVDGTDTTYGNATAVNDIIGVYIDLDNNKIYFSENGTLNNSGTGQSISAVSATTQGLYFVIGGDYSSGTVGIHQFNFGGCAAFTVSSAVSDDNGHGNFEYSPNITGDSVAKKFYAICSKNLAEFG